MPPGVIPGRDSLFAPRRASERFPDADIHALLTLRRTLHHSPELSNVEYQTADRLTEALTAIGILDVRRIGDTGIVARVPGRDRAAPCVAVRGDIDALPIQEATGLPFASHVDGVRTLEDVSNP